LYASLKYARNARNTLKTLGMRAKAQGKSSFASLAINKSKFSNLQYLALQQKNKK
jgi:hypothetical protein